MPLLSSRVQPYLNKRSTGMAARSGGGWGWLTFGRFKVTMPTLSLVSVRTLSKALLLVVDDANKRTSFCRDRRHRESAPARIIIMSMRTRSCQRRQQAQHARFFVRPGQTEHRGFLLVFLLMDVEVCGLNGRAFSLREEKKTQPSAGGSRACRACVCRQLFDYDKHCWCTRTYLTEGWRGGCCAARTRQELGRSGGTETWAIFFSLPHLASNCAAARRTERGGRSCILVLHAE